MLLSVISSILVLLKTLEDGVVTVDSFETLIDTNIRTTAINRVYYTIRPEQGSVTRCRLDMPDAAEWNGELWGRGGDGKCGFLRDSDWNTRGMVRNHRAAMICDGGTGEYENPSGSHYREPWPMPVVKDCAWRSIHLMTVYGRQLCEKFYGRPIARAYFDGGSTGGRQALGEAMRFPKDYDGIMAHLTVNSMVSQIGSAFHLYKLAHDEETGELLFTTNQMCIVSDAAVEYMKDRDPAPYAGHFLKNPLAFTEADIDGFLKLALEKDSTLAQGDRMARLKEMFMGKVHRGRRVYHGQTPGAYHGRNMNWSGITFDEWVKRFKGVGFPMYKVTWDDFDRYAAEYGPLLNTCSTELKPFFDRGGKLIMTGGLEDQGVLPSEIVSYYLALAKKFGGIENLKRHCRLFLMPGTAHGGGKGRVWTSAADGPLQQGYLVDWVTKGKAPIEFRYPWYGAKTDFIAPVFPADFDYQQIRRADSFYLQTKLEVEN